MRSYLFTFALAAVIGVLLTPLAGALGRRLGALDRTVDPPVPRFGGLAIGTSAALALGLLALVFDPVRALLGYSRLELAAVYVGGAVIFALGVVDDLHALKATPKLLAEVAVAAGLYAAGVRASTVWLPLGIVDLGHVAGFLFTVVWIVGITNAFNLLDGIDGAAAGAAIFALLAVFFASVQLGNPLVALLTVALAGATLGFLRWNFAPARIFLGDSGSLFLGFVLATLALRGATKGATIVAIAIPVVAFALPVTDTLISMLRRGLRGAPLMTGDREHFHHRLLAMGLTVRQAVALLYVVSGAFALASMLFLNPNLRSLAVFLTMLAVLVWFAERHLKVFELTELARIARRGFVQTRAISFNVDVRKAAHQLDGAGTWDAVVATLARLFDRSEFDAVRLVLHDGGPGAPRREFLLEGGTIHEQAVAPQPDEWGVHLPFHLGAAGTVRGELAVFRRYGRRALLTDVNLLVEVLRPALAAAAGRVTPPPRDPAAAVAPRRRATDPAPQARPAAPDPAAPVRP
ncbi:MAG TPA: MraY family glycosyltransferase [Gemmatimonadales bacterium]|nr:MraY family glycosyltransferase [Gemmatimonadales bacterium]